MKKIKVLYMPRISISQQESRRRKSHRTFKTRLQSRRKRRQQKEKYAPCCICMEPVKLLINRDSEVTSYRERDLIPGQCYKKYGLRGHRVCYGCWHEGKNGNPSFIDSASHKCPGCVRGMPLTDFPFKKSSQVVEILDSDEE